MVHCEEDIKLCNDSRLLKILYQIQMIIVYRARYLYEKRIKRFQWSDKTTKKNNKKGKIEKMVKHRHNSKEFFQTMLNFKTLIQSKNQWCNLW